MEKERRFINTISVDYHDGKSLLNLEDLRTGLVGPYDEGAQGVVIWGSSSESKTPEFLDVSHITTQSNYSFSNTWGFIPWPIRKDTICVVLS